MSSCGAVRSVLNTERMNGADRELAVGQRLRALRLRAGLSQRELARRAAVSNATISMIEADRVSPSVSALRQVLSRARRRHRRFLRRARAARRAGRLPRRRTDRDRRRRGFLSPGRRQSQGPRAADDPRALQAGRAIGDQDAVASGRGGGLGDQGPADARSRRPPLRTRRRATPISSTAASRTASATPATASSSSSRPARRRPSRRMCRPRPVLVSAATNGNMARSPIAPT